jgi:acetyl esterase/lipase
MKMGICFLMLSIVGNSALAQVPGPGPTRPTPADWASPTGPYKVVMEVDATLADHTIYRPVDLKIFPKRDNLPTVIMSGPGCDFDGDSYRPFWTEIASYGYLVVAVGLPVPDGTRAKMWNNTAADLLSALDWSFAENSRKGGKYFGRIDTSNVALFGQSCGGIQALRLAHDPRIRTLVFWNSGSVLMGNVGPTDNTKRMNLNPSKDLMGDTDLKKLATSLTIPTAYFVGDKDMARPRAMEDFNDIQNIPMFLGVREIPGDSHGGTFREKNGGAYGKVGVAWLNWITKGDKQAAAMFKGENSSLADDPKWVEIKRKNIE